MDYSLISEVVVIMCTPAGGCSVGDYYAIWRQWKQRSCDAAKMEWRSKQGMPMLIFTLLILFLNACLAFESGVYVYRDGSYKLHVDHEDWLRSGPARVQAFGTTFTTADGTLNLLSTRKSHGKDEFGSWNKTTYNYVLENHSVSVILSVKTYPDAQFHLFEQSFPDGLPGTSIGDMNKLSTSYPTFDLSQSDPSTQLGMLAYAGTFFCLNDIVQPFKADMPRYADGIEGGPLVLFDKTGKVAVLSPFDNFMIASSQYDVNTTKLGWGLAGTVKQIPAGFSYKTIVYFTYKGINKAMQGWGKILRKYYKKDHMSRYEDPTVKYLGYYTDNGAYYYHKTEPGMNYEETLLAVYKDALSQNIPYRYLQYDDWWYPNDGRGYGGAISWEPMSNVFPHGLQYIFNITRRTVIAHNRYWSNDTIYARQNGGKYKFFLDGKYSLPLEQAFWDDLFSEAVQWGLSVYEQDWLVTQSEVLSVLHDNVDGGRNWLRQMGEAASRFGLRLQYCMALPRHVLQSLEVPVVTQVRSSIDYLLKPNQWMIGVSSMLADAVGLAPFKDTFWTTSVEPGQKWTERNPELEGLVSLLSTGPVGPGDRLNYTNAKLLKSLCTADGLLLKPCKPATSIDDQLIQQVFQDGSGPSGPVMTTYSEVSGQFFGIIFSADLTNSYSITPAKSGFVDQEYFVYNYKDGSSTGRKLDRFSNSKPLKLAECSHQDFCLYYGTPVLSYNGLNVGILGELEKKVPFSSRRISSIELDSDDLRVTLIGTQDELVEWYFYVEPQWMKISCQFSKSGKAVVSLLRKSCQTI